MIVFCNGAYKSGSTWLFRIVDAMMDFQHLPQPYRHPLYPVMARIHKLGTFLKTGKHLNEDFIVKGHIQDRKTRDLLLSHEGVFVLNIKRDLRDVLVSHYYHLVRQRTIKEGFRKYYWRIGRYKAHQMRQYHEVWDQNSQRVLCTEFEALKRDFDAVVGDVAAFLGLDLSAGDMERIRQQTSLEKSRQDWNEDEKDESLRFFRGGRIGDWQEHFDSEISEDLQSIVDRGLRGTDRVIYYILFEARRSAKTALTGRHAIFTKLLKRV